MRLPLLSRLRGRPRSRGQSVVEFALVVPIFILMLLVAIDFGRLFFTYIQVSNAAREATSYGATQPTDLAGMTVRAEQEKSSQSQGEVPLDPLVATCSTPAGVSIPCSSAPGSGGAGNTLTVTVTQRFSFLTPLVSTFFGSNLKLSASATTAVLVSAIGGTGGGPGTCAPPSNATFTVFASDLDVIVNPAGSMPDSGVCTISGYNWDFGDGTTDVGSSIPTMHTYSSPGTYIITLEVTNQAGSLNAIRSVTVPPTLATPTPTPAPTGGPTPTPTPTVGPTPEPTPCPLPVAGFTWVNLPGKEVRFTDTSSASVECPITNWLWTFGHGNPPSQTNAQNPDHDFPNNNTNYQVTLRVTNSSGVHEITRTVQS